MSTSVLVFAWWFAWYNPQSTQIEFVVFKGGEQAQIYCEAARKLKSQTVAVSRCYEGDLWPV